MKLAVVLTLVKCLLLCARGLWAVSLHRAGGAFQRLLSPEKTSAGSGAHVLESHAAPSWAHTLWGFPPD